MLNSDWILIKLTRPSNKYLIFRKKHFCQKKMTSLVETHLFNTKKVRLLQSEIFSKAKNIRKMLKINLNRQFYWFSRRF